MSLADYELWQQGHLDKSVRLLNIEPETISDGLGLRMSLYLSGCHHRCPGCHNPSSWNKQKGEVIDVHLLERIIVAYQENPLLDGMTFSGGDPLFNPIGFYHLLKTIKSEIPNLNVWIYTGYRFEEVLNLEYGKNILELTNILVDGRFEQKLFLPDLVFRGSLNQKIIDVQQSLNLNRIIEIKMDPE